MQVIDPGKKSEDNITLHKLNRISAFRNIHLAGVDTILHEQETTGSPSFYSFEIEDPLLENYRKELNAKDINILEFIPPDKYLVSLESQTALYDSQWLLFTKDVAFYSSRTPRQVEVRSFDEYVPPKLHNDMDRQITGVDALIASAAVGILYNGDGKS